MSVALPARRWTANGRFIDLVVVVAVLAVDVVGMALASAGRDVESPPFGAAAVVRRRRQLRPVAVAPPPSSARPRRPRSGRRPRPPASPSRGLLSQRTGVTLVVAIVRRGGVERAPAVGGGDPGAHPRPARRRRRWTTGRRSSPPSSPRSPSSACRGRSATRRGRGGCTSRRSSCAWPPPSATARALARRAVVEERAHIARELHDVVAHHVSLIGVQAGAARSTLPAGATDTRAALVAIEDASRSAVGEMRRLLDVMRSRRGCSRGRPATRAR